MVFGIRGRTVVLECGHNENELVKDITFPVCGRCGFEVVPLFGQAVERQLHSEEYPPALGQKAVGKRQVILFAHKSECIHDNESNTWLIPAPKESLMRKVYTPSGGEYELRRDTKVPSNVLAGSVDIMEAFYGRKATFRGWNGEHTVGKIFVNVKKFIGQGTNVYVQTFGQLSRKLAETSPDKIKLTGEMTHALSVRGFYALLVTYEIGNKADSWQKVLKQEGYEGVMLNQKPVVPLAQRPAVKHFLQFLDPEVEILVFPYAGASNQ